MTINFALEYIPRRTEEMCWGHQYSIRLRHFVLQPLEGKLIEVKDCIFILVDPSREITVESDMGCYDVYFNNSEEFQYEYQTDIMLRNNSPEDVFSVKFIQVIPKKFLPCG